jgi:hypothetical protein
MYNRNPKTLLKTAYQVCAFSLRIFIVQNEWSFDRVHFSAREHSTQFTGLLRTRLSKIYNDEKQQRGEVIQRSSYVAAWQNKILTFLD